MSNRGEAVWRPFASVRQLADSVILRSAAQLFSGRVIAMAIALGSAPVVARLFAPEDYGVAALFLAVVTVISAVLAGGYHRAVLIPQEDEVAARLFTLAISISLMLSLLLYVVLVVVAAVGTDLYQNFRMGNLVWLVPFAAVVIAVRDALNVLLLRRGRFASIATVDVTQAATSAGLRVLWGITLRSSAFGLVLGQLAGFMVAMVLLAGRVASWLRGMLAGCTWREIWRLAVQFQDYPRFRILAQLAFVAGAQLPVLALGLIFPSETVGFFAMAHRVAALPLQAASQAFSEAMLRKTIRQHHQKQLMRPDVLRAAVAMLAGGVPIFAGMFFFGSDLLTWFLGRRWAEAGSILEILAVYLFFYWVAAPFYPLLEALRKNKAQLWLYCGQVLTTAATFFLCYLASLEAMQTIWAFALVSSVQQLVIIATAVRAMHQHDGAVTGHC